MQHQHRFLAAALAICLGTAQAASQAPVAVGYALAVV